MYNSETWMVYLCDKCELISRTVIMATDQKRVVVLPIDGSKQSEEAVEWYAKFLHRSDNKVVLAHAPEGPTLAMSQGQHLNEGEIQKMVKKEKEETSAMQKKYDAKLKAYNLQAVYKTVYGKPGEAIVAAALELKADMVVMGTRGQGTLRRTIMGSVSDYVVHHAHCPVIVCRK